VSQPRHAPQTAALNVEFDAAIATSSALSDQSRVRVVAVCEAHPEPRERYLSAHVGEADR